MKLRGLLKFLATASVFGNGERRRREERRQEAIARRQLLSIFPPTEEPADFSSPHLRAIFRRENLSAL